MDTREVHELAADIMTQLAEGLDLANEAGRRLRAGALLNEAMQVHSGCDAPDWALELAQGRLAFGQAA
jgi:hypothetical protein